MRQALDFWLYLAISQKLLNRSLLNFQPSMLISSGSDKGNGLFSASTSGAFIQQNTVSGIFAMLAAFLFGPGYLMEYRLLRMNTINPVLAYITLGVMTKTEVQKITIFRVGIFLCYIDWFVGWLIEYSLTSKVVQGMRLGSTRSPIVSSWTRYQC